GHHLTDILCPESTPLAPSPAPPVFGTIPSRSAPAELCVELKSLKLYLHRFRDVGSFYEAVVNRLLDDFVAACAPKRCTVVGAFTARGGLTTTVTCEHEAGGEATRSGSP